MLIDCKFIKLCIEKVKSRKLNYSNKFNSIRYRIYYNRYQIHLLYYRHPFERIHYLYSQWLCNQEKNIDLHFLNFFLFFYRFLRWSQCLRKSIKNLLELCELDSESLISLSLSERRLFLALIKLRFFK